MFSATRKWSCFSISCNLQAGQLFWGVKVSTKYMIWYGREWKTTPLLQTSSGILTSAIHHPHIIQSSIFSWGPIFLPPIWLSHNYFPTKLQQLSIHRNRQVVGAWARWFPSKLLPLRKTGFNNGPPPKRMVFTNVGFQCLVFCCGDSLLLWLRHLSTKLIFFHGKDV